MKYILTAILACSLGMGTMSAVAATSDKDKPAKPLSCKQQAKAKNFKSKKERANFMAECKKSSKK